MSETTEPPLLHETKALNPWQPERDLIMLAILGKLLEELGEATAIVARCVIQDVHESEPVTGKRNIEALQNEIADVYATMGMAQVHLALNDREMSQRVHRKQQHLLEWHRLIREAGR